MTEADRVFPSRAGPNARTSAERRVVIVTPRKRTAGAATSRVVEVVHLRRNGARPAAPASHSAEGKVRAEAWPDGFRARTAALPLPESAEPVATELA
jgi:hypothetical protein